MKANKNTSFFKILASFVGIAGVSALMSVPALALTNLTRTTTGSIHSQAVPPTTDDTFPGTQPDDTEDTDEREDTEQQDQQGTGID